MNHQIYLGESCPNHQKKMQRMLAGLATVTLFEDGFSLYEAVHRNAPHLVIVNILLPPLQPWTLIRLLKFDSRFTALPILCISALDEPGLPERMRRLGARATLSTHSDSATVEEAVTTLLNLPNPTSGFDVITETAHDRLKVS